MGILTRVSDESGLGKVIVLMGAAVAVRTEAQTIFFQNPILKRVWSTRPRPR